MREPRSGLLPVSPVTGSLLVVMVAIVVAVVSACSDGPRLASAQSLSEDARDAQSRIVEALSDGDLLRIEFELFDGGQVYPPDMVPASLQNAGRLFETVTIGVTGNGRIRSINATIADRDGTLLATSHMEGGERVLVDAASGEEWRLPLIAEEARIEPWIEGHLSVAGRLVDWGFEATDSGVLSGHASTLFELTVELDGRPDVRREIEVANDHPLYVRESHWTQAEGEPEHLVYEMIIRSIEVIEDSGGADQ